MQVLTEADVMEGVSELASKIYVEPIFDDGTKLVVLQHPIRKAGKDIPEKEQISKPPLPGKITINAGKPTITLTVINTSDHHVQITSHMPFWEINQRMHFDREQARGYRLDIPSGGAIRWEPGETKEVRLCLLK
jgi:urease subunit gamma/beta